MNSQSMPRFARMLEEAYKDRGHEVTSWAPKPYVHRWLGRTPLGKWAGYIDQYILFPLWVRRQLRDMPRDQLYVFADQALGPWVPLVANRPHVVHVHDLLALRSALGEVPENPTRWSGRVYQRYIRWGFRHGRYFICISRKTRNDLIRYAGVSRNQAAVVYNGLNYPYRRVADPAQVSEALQKGQLPASEKGFLLHISGNQWYKNVVGVIGIYAEYCRRVKEPAALWLLGDMDQEGLAVPLKMVPPHGRVVFARGLSNETLEAAYSAAGLMLFPSLAEGFGWPIVEAQSCGCPVLTTDEAPMNEVGGPVSAYLPRLRPEDDFQAWCAAGARRVDDILALNGVAREALTRQCQEWAVRFRAERAIDDYLLHYSEALQPIPTPLHPSTLGN